MGASAKQATINTVVSFPTTPPCSLMLEIRSAHLDRSGNCVGSGMGHRGLNGKADRRTMLGSLVQHGPTGSDVKPPVCRWWLSHFTANSGRCHVVVQVLNLRCALTNRLPL